MQRTVAVAAMLVCSLAVFAQTKQSAREAMEQYLAMDADGRLYNDNWNSYSHKFTWFDAPGWDIQTIIRSYKLGAVTQQGKKATAKVTYFVIGRYLNNEVVAHRETESVTYHLVRSTKRSVVDSSNELVPATTAERWAVDAPQLNPHRSVRQFCSQVRLWDADMQKTRPWYPKLIEFCNLHGSLK